MDPTATDTITVHGDPLAFKVRQGGGRPSVLSREGSDVFKVEARQLTGHQKEAVVTEGAEGSAWRLTSDEGAHLKGTDLAPFPLGFFNAGLQSDLYRTLLATAADRGVPLEGLRIRLVNHYWLTGSFIQGTGEGHAENPDIDIELQTSASDAAVSALVRAAVDASPAMALLRTPLTRNTFALYINGRRREVEDAPNSTAQDAADPYRVYSRAPRPLAGAELRGDLIEKTGEQESGTPQPASASGRVIRAIHGAGAPDADGLFEVDTWLAMPGASHFRFRSDESERDRAPSGLALLSAGISFCYMTQLARYIENMKMQIRGVRLVQFNPFASGSKASADAIDTHLFLNGEAPDEIHAKLLTVAARTCYLHAAAAAPLDPQVRIVRNGTPLSRAA